MSDYLHVGPRLDGVVIVNSDALAAMTERHHLMLGVGGKMTVKAVLA